MWRSGSIQEATTEGIDIPRNPAKYQNKETEESSSEQYPHKVSKSKGARRVQQVEQNREEEHQAEKQTYIRNLADAIDQQLRDEQVGFMEKTIMCEPDCHPTYYHWAVLRVDHHCMPTLSTMRKHLTACTEKLSGSYWDIMESPPSWWTSLKIAMLGRPAG